MTVVFGESLASIGVDKNMSGPICSILSKSTTHRIWKWLDTDRPAVGRASSAGRVPGVRLNQDILPNQTPAHQAIEGLTRPGPGGPGEFMFGKFLDLRTFI